MEGALKLWVVIVAVGALNYLSRVSFIAFFASREMPPLLARALKFVPAAMLTALVLPMVLAPSAAGTLAGVNPRIPAAIVASILERPFAAMVIGREAPRSEPQVKGDASFPVAGRRVLIVDDVMSAGSSSLTSS